MLGDLIEASVDGSASLKHSEITKKDTPTKKQLFIEGDRTI